MGGSITIVSPLAFTLGQIQAIGGTGAQSDRAQGSDAGRGASVEGRPVDVYIIHRFRRCHRNKSRAQAVRAATGGTGWNRILFRRGTRWAQCG